MPDSLQLIDTLLRGMIVGAELLIALVFLSRRPVTWRRGLGAAFIVAIACCVINTSPPLRDAFGAFIAPLRLLSIVAPVIFWWFALALVDDGFRMRPPALALLLLVAPLAIASAFAQEGAIWTASLTLARLTAVSAFGHAV